MKLLLVPESVIRWFCVTWRKHYSFCSSFVMSLFKCTVKSTLFVSCVGTDSQYSNLFVSSVGTDSQLSNLLVSSVRTDSQHSNRFVSSVGTDSQHSNRFVSSVGTDSQQSILLEAPKIRCKNWVTKAKKIKKL